MGLLAGVVARVGDAGFRPASIDATVIAETVRVAPHRDAIRHSLAEALGLDVGDVSVKATSTDGLGFLGHDEGLAAACVALVVPV